MPKRRAPAPSWSFARRFRTSAFGWKGSRLAVERLHEAIAELRAVAAVDPLRAAEGAVLLCERLSPALQDVDSSSGALGTAANRAVAAAVRLVADAPAELAVRRTWLARLFEALQEDGIGWLCDLGEAWGELCGDATLANEWADSLLGLTRTCLLDSRPGASFVGIVPCLAALQRAGRHGEILALLATLPGADPRRRFLVSALAAVGRVDEAVAAAMPLGVQGHACAERILREAGCAERAWQQFGRLRPMRGSALAHFHAARADYPTLLPARLLHDLIETSPGDESLWFAAAVEIGDHELAIRLVQQGPANLAAVLRIVAAQQETAPRLVYEVARHTLQWLERGRGGRATEQQVAALLAAMLGAAPRLGFGHDAILQQTTGLVEMATRPDSVLARLLARLPRPGDVPPAAASASRDERPLGVSVSATFLAFLQPFLGDDAAAQDAALRIGMLAWNGVLLEEDAGDPSTLAACRERLAAQGDPALFEWVVGWRRRAFAAHRWLIVHCEFFVDAAGQRRLRVGAGNGPRGTAPAS